MQISYKESYKKAISKIKKKDIVLYQRIRKKVIEIINNPEHYKPLRNVLKGLRRIQFGSYVLKYEVKENDITFIDVTPHDQAY